MMIDRLILAELVRRAAELTTANGYHTDAGANLYQGRVFDLENDPLPGLVITQPDFDSDVVDDDEDAANPQMTSEFVIEGYRTVDKSDPLPETMDLREDLIRCFYRPGAADQIDTLGIEGCGCRMVATSKVMPDSGSTTAMAQLTLRVEYIQPIEPT